MEHSEKTAALALMARFLRMKWRLPLQICAAVVALMLLMGFSVSRRREDAGIKGPHQVVRPGVVESLYAKSVGSPFDGQVSQVAVQPGQAVKKGELLFAMDPTPYVQQLAGAQAACESARQGLAQIRAQRAAELAQVQHEIRLLKQQLAAEEAAGQGQPRVEYVSGFGTVVVGDYSSVGFDPYRASAMRTQIRQSRAMLAERQASWEPVIAGASEQVAEAARQVADLRTLIKSARRVSPIEGVVTRVDARPGEQVASQQPLVRVDNPQGYRVVTLVDEDVREELRPGLAVSLKSAERVDSGQLEKIEAGEERELFKYWLWVKPASTDRLTPGSPVDVVLDTGA
jgi:multidrug resistance efflux pump